MKKTTSLFLLIVISAFSLELPKPTYDPERVSATLQLLENVDLSHYKTIACYDSSEQLVKTLASFFPDRQMYHLNPQISQAKIVPPKKTLLIRIFNAFTYAFIPPSAPKAENLLKYDLIFCPFIHIFNHQREQIIDSFHPYLRIGGHVVLRGFALPSPNDPLAVTFRRLAQQEKWILVLKDFSLSSYELSFTQAKILFPSDKWRNVSIQAESVSVTFDNKNALHNWISHWLAEFPFNPPLLVDKKQELTNDFINEYLLHSQIGYTSANIRIEAYKR